MFLKSFDILYIMQVIVGNAVVIENTIIFEIIDEENFAKDSL